MFSGFDLSDLEKIGPLFKDELYEEEGVLFNEGDPEKGLYVIEKGLVKAAKKVDDGGEKVVASFGARDFFGEMALLGEEYTHTVTTRVLGPTKLLFLSRQDFETLAKDEIHIAFRLTTIIARTIEQRLWESHEEIANLANWGKEIRGIQTRFREMIDEGEEIRIVLANDRQLLGRIEGYAEGVGGIAEGVGGIEVLFRDSTGHLFVIPYHALQYFIIQEVGEVKGVGE